MENFIRIYDNALPPEFCRDVIARFEADKNKFPGAMSGYHGNVVEKGKTTLELAIATAPGWTDVDSRLRGCLMSYFPKYRDAVKFLAGSALSMTGRAGLYSDRIARLAGARPDVRIIPFRGEYYMVRPDRRELVRGLIYPVPDPEFPFLGVHFTRTVHGEVEAGPNAVLAFAREGYRFGHIHAGELAGTLGYPGFWAMARRYWRMGTFEMYRSLSTAAFVRALQRLVPAVRAEDVERGGAGVRAQAVSPDGSLVDDFRIVTGPDSVHVLNAPSPAATASLAIGRHVAGLAAETLGLT